jgi:hypothetical protein
MGKMRKYLPTFADLADRLSIVRLKQIFIQQHREQYKREAYLIQHDIDLILSKLPPLGAHECNALQLLAIANRWIWENESAIRNGTSTEPADIQLARLKATHAVNGVRNTAKNVLAAFEAGARQDYKVDCFAADLPPEFGNWSVF